MHYIDLSGGSTPELIRKLINRDLDGFTNARLSIALLGFNLMQFSH